MPCPNCPSPPSTPTPCSLRRALPPADAWTLFATGQALLVDVRTVEELVYVGRVPGSVHVPWATGTAQTRNPRFVRELEKRVPQKDGVVLLLCRSGKRSAAAAVAATAAGYTQVFNVLEGFEGERDATARRQWLALPRAAVGAGLTAHGQTAPPDSFRGIPRKCAQGLSREYRNLTATVVMAAMQNRGLSIAVRCTMPQCGMDRRPMPR